MIDFSKFLFSSRFNLDSSSISSSYISFVPVLSSILLIKIISDEVSHVHLYAHCSGKVNTRNCHYFNLICPVGSDPDRCTHGASCGSPSVCIRYCRRGGDFIEYGSDVIVRRSVGEIVNSGTSGAVVMEALRIYVYNSRSP